MSRVAVSLIAILVAVAGCGGGDDGSAGGGGGGGETVSLSDPGAARAPAPRLGMEAFRREANRFCREGAARANRIGRQVVREGKRTGQPPWELIERLQAETRRMWEGAQALRPPAEVEDRWLRLIQANDDTRQSLAEMDQAVERRDLQAYVALSLSTFHPATGSDEHFVRELRLPNCRPRTLEELRRIR